MNVDSRLRRIENKLGSDACMACGADVRVRPALKPEAEETLARYRTAGASAVEAQRMLSEDSPLLARALGVYTKPGGGHFCVHCGSDRRGAAELASDAFARYRPHVESDEAVLALLKEDAPDWASALAA